MSQKTNNRRRYEDNDNTSSNQTIRLVKDVKDEDSNETHEVDVLADFKPVDKNPKEEIKEEKQHTKEDENTKKIHVVEVESNNNDNDYIPFEPTRELKVQRGSSYHDNDEYKERVIVNSSPDSVGVKKIIVGEETTALPVYKPPKKDPQVIIRDVFIYLLMVAIVSILVILLLKYCSDSKNDEREILDRTVSPKTTTKYTSQIPNTETTTTTSSAIANTETTTTISSKAPGQAIPTTVTVKYTTTTTTKATTTTTTTVKPTEATEPVEETTTKVEETTENQEETNDDEQG